MSIEERLQVAQDEDFISHPRHSVYFIVADEVMRVKIGVAAKPLQRISKLQTASPVKLKLLATMPGAFDTEVLIHDLFDASRYIGEWFEWSAALGDFIRTYAAIPVFRERGGKLTIGGYKQFPPTLP